MVTHPPSGSAVLATYGCLLSISLIMILARFYLRIRIHRAQRLLISDILMGVAWCSALTTATFDLILRNRGALRPDIDWTLSNFETSQENYEYVGKMLWASGIPFYATLYLCKLSLLAVYFQLFPIFMKELRIALWLTFGFVVLSYIVTMCLYLFLCFPLERNWRVPAPELLCPPTISAMVFQIGWALHFIASLAMFVLPFFVLRKLQMRRAMLVGAYGALSLGAIDIAFSLTRFLSVQLSGEVTDRPMTLIELWSALDMMVGLIVTCLPSLRPYLRRNFKASSADDSRGPNSRTPNQHGISVNRTVITTSKPVRWNDHGHFEEIEEDRVGENKDRVVMMGNDVQINERDYQRRVSWQDDKCSNNSDVELIEMKR